jgi:hypothetical protein
MLLFCSFNLLLAPLISGLHYGQGKPAAATHDKADRAFVFANGIVGRSI